MRKLNFFPLWKCLFKRVKADVSSLGRILNMSRKSLLKGGSSVPFQSFWGMYGGSPRVCRLITFKPPQWVRCAILEREGRQMLVHIWTYGPQGMSIATYKILFLGTRNRKCSTYFLHIPSCFCKPFPSSLVSLENTHTLTQLCTWSACSKSDFWQNEHCLHLYFLVLNWQFTT